MLYKATMMAMFVVGAQALPTGGEAHALDTKIDQVAAKVSMMAATCPLDQCRPGGTYNGAYTFTPWKGNPAGCSDTYCYNYKPGGMFASRCTAPSTTFARGYADEECIGTCNGCPTDGCQLNTCRPGGSYNGQYTFTTWKGNPAGCNEAYCDFYLPGGRFHSRCSAPKGSFERGYADEECAGSCLGMCPTPEPPVPKSPKCDVAAYQRYQAALKAADKAKKTALAAGVFNDATATAAANAADTLYAASAAAAKTAADAEALYAAAKTQATLEAAEAAELAAQTAYEAAETAEQAYMAAWSSDSQAQKQAADAKDRAIDAHDAAVALKAGKC